MLTEKRVKWLIIASLFLGIGGLLLPVQSAEWWPKAGWKIIYEGGCLGCHALWGMGNPGGTDLARLTDQHRMAKWPITHKRYLAKEFPAWSPQEMRQQLASFLRFISSLDGPGNPSQGERIFYQKRCYFCHGKLAPDLSQQAYLVNPVAWLTLMWNHAPQMKETMDRLGLKWPYLSNNDLTDLIAYLNRLCPSIKPVYFTPGDKEAGERLLRQKHCLRCHSIRGEGGQIGPELTHLKNELDEGPPRTYGQMATLMWNNFPAMYQAMQREGLDFPQFSGEDLLDILAYLLAIQER